MEAVDSHFSGLRSHAQTVGVLPNGVSISILPSSARAKLDGLVAPPNEYWRGLPLKRLVLLNTVASAAQKRHTVGPLAGIDRWL